MRSLCRLTLFLFLASRDNPGSDYLAPLIDFIREDGEHIFAIKRHCCLDVKKKMHVHLFPAVQILVGPGLYLLKLCGYPLSLVQVKRINPEILCFASWALMVGGTRLRRKEAAVRFPSRTTVQKY